MSLFPIYINKQKPSKPQVYYPQIGEPTWLVLREYQCEYCTEMYRAKYIAIEVKEMSPFKGKYLIPSVTKTKLK